MSLINALVRLIIYLRLFASKETVSQECCKFCRDNDPHHPKSNDMPGLAGRKVGGNYSADHNRHEEGDVSNDKPFCIVHIYLPFVSTGFTVPTETTSQHFRHQQNHRHRHHPTKRALVTEPRIFSNAAALLAATLKAEGEASVRRRSGC